MSYMLSGQPHLLRDINGCNILHLVREQGPISRIDIARRIGISQTAVSRIVAHLLESKLLLEVEEDSTALIRSVGRQPVFLRFNPNAGHVLTVDIGRTVTSFALTNFGGAIIARKNISSDLDQRRDEVLERITSHIMTFLASQQLELPQVEGLGVTIPGLVMAPHGIIRTFGRWKEWVNFNLHDYFERKLGIPTYVEGDIRAIALAEHLIGAGKASKNMVCLCVTDAGPAAGIIYNDQLIRGVTDSAGEVGSTLVGYYIKSNRLYRSLFQESDNILFDQVVQPAALLAIAKKEIKSGLEIKGLEGTPISENLTVSQIVHAAELGDHFCQALLQEFGAIIGALCINIVNFFNPDLIVLHGEMFLGDTIALEAARKTVQEHVLPLPVEAVKIVASELKEDGYILGGASLVLSDLFNPPKINRETIRSPRRMRPYVVATSS